MSEDQKENAKRNLLSKLDCLLSTEREDPLHLSDHPPNTLLVITDDFTSDFKYDFPWPLIEETIDETQIEFEMIYIGQHFNKLPEKVKDRMLGHGDWGTRGIIDAISNILLTLDGDVQEWAFKLFLKCYPHEPIRSMYIQMTTNMVEDGKGGKCSSRWKLLSSYEMKKLLLGNTSIE